MSTSFRLAVVGALAAGLAATLCGCEGAASLDDVRDAGAFVDGGAGGPADAGAARDDAGGPGSVADAGVDDEDDAGGAEPADGGTIADGGAALTVTSCFADITSQTGVSPDYEPFHPIVGSHCEGTNHQDITGIERVVFLGDSVTVGTPPTASAETYRALLADALADRFGLSAPSAIWKSVNPLEGMASIRSSGDFWSCAKWGARDDDLMADNSQIWDCFPDEELGKKTLVVMTMGGNDIAAITKAGADGASIADVTATMDAAIDDFRAAIELLKDPTVFPGGVDVVFTNNFEFTDGSGDVNSCPSASAAGFGEPWEDPQALAQLVVHMMEQYLAIAVETQSDMLFVLETFCGHGYNNEDPANGCYRGPGTPRWFDVSCIHPNPEGHAALAGMFMDVVDE